MTFREKLTRHYLRHGATIQLETAHLVIFFTGDMTFTFEFDDEGNCIFHNWKRG